MPTYFSINDGNFSNGLATVVGDVSAAGTSGFLLTTSYNYTAILATTPNPETPIYGVAFQLSAVSGSPTGTIDLILSATNGASTTASFPISGLTQKSGLRSAITPTNPVGWQVFAFNSPVTFPTGRSMRIGVKTSVSNKVSLIGQSLTNLNRSYITTLTGNPGSVADVVHIVGSLSSTGLVTRTVNYNVSGVPVTYGNFYVHNGGVLNFDPTISTTITLAGTLGMQITPDGTVNIGTSSSPVLSSVTHSINLSNSYINVHNGASFNVYGAYKTPYLLFSADTIINNGFYSTTTDPKDWIVGDTFVLTPNVSSYNTTEVTTLLSKPTSFTIQAFNNPIYVHNASNYIPSVVNMTRNVQISANSGYIRFLDGSNSNVNNAQFKGFRNATYKGLQFCTDSTGSVSLSNCAFNGDAVATMPAFSFDSTKTPTSNVSIMGCNFFGYGATTDIVTLNAVSANNFTFTNNIVLSASQNGMLINALSSTYANIKDNFLIGNVQNGLRVTNPYVLSGGIGGIGCMNNVCGCVVSGSNNRANYDGLAGHYNNKEGVNILGTIPQLSSTNFLNLTANNNKTSGVVLSGNSNNLLTPIKVNINGLIANNNKNEGFEGNAITGNLSSMSFNNNETGNVLISIGNADTIFDGITSTNTNTSYVESFGTSGALTVNANTPFVGVDGSLYGAGATTEFLSAFDTDFSFPYDFTIECWINTSVSTLDTVARRVFGFGSGASGGVSNGLQLILGTEHATAASTLTVFTSTALIQGTTTVADGNWHHVAISRVDGVMRLFVDGTKDGDSIDNTTVFDAGATLPLVIFRYAGALNGRFVGYFSNFRITSKTGLYSEDFTIPSDPFSMIANTSLLVNGTDYANKTYKHLYQSNIDVLSGRNYSATLFKNSNLEGNIVNAIRFNNTKFEQFSMDSSTLSSNVEDIGSSSDIDFLQGSYQFNNCTFGSGILSSTIENYQPEVFTENGFVVMKENSVANTHYRLLRAGKISLDTTVVKSPNTVSEKLEPKSIITKLRCGSKMIPVNKDDSYTVGCYVYKSSGYSGAEPRLVLKHNSAIGYQDTVLATSVGADETWEYLSGTVPVALDQGIFEVYVDCSGENGSGSVNISDWTLTLV